MMTWSVDPGGTLALVRGTGLISGAEAEELNARTLEGGDLFLVPVIVIAEPGVELSGEARQAFGAVDRRGRSAPVGIVTANAPLRVLVGFLLRISRAPASVKVFATEAEARAFVGAAPAAGQAVGS